MMLARAVDQQIDVTEVELGGLRLHLLPVHRRLYRIRVQVFQRRPYLRQCAGPGAEVVDLSA